MCACYVRLRDSWDNDVFARGFAVLDGRFVLDIEATDAEGRPTQVLILDLRPDLAYRDADRLPAAPDRRFVTRSTRIIWTTERPTVDPRDPEGGRE
jgi:hypothetical protein